ncbi:MAG: MFS transporter [Actinobacteria bacterium]|nr:MFS transporter [Actinomycetota bacterium]
MNISFFYTFFVIAFCYTVTSPVLIELSRSTQTTIDVAGRIFSFYFIGFITGCYLSIWLISYLKRKNLLLTAYFLLFAAVLLLKFTSNFTLITGLFILIGLANGFSESQISTLIIELNKGSEGLFTNLSQSLFGIGAFLGPLVTVAIMDLGFYWKNTYIAAGIICFVNIILFALSDISEYESPKIKITPNIFKSIKLDNGTVFTLLVMALFFYACTEISLSNWIPTFLRAERAFTEIFAGQVVSFFWFAIIIGRIFTGLFSKKFGILRVLISITSLATVSVIFGIYSRSAAGIFISFIFTGFFLAGIWPLLVTEGGIMFPDNRNSVVSLLVLFGGSGGILIPIILGFVYNKFGLFIAMNLSYIFLFLLLVFLLILFFYRKRHNGKSKDKN